MKYKCLLAFFLILATPAFAGDYLIFPPGTDTGQQWIGPKPEPGVHCPIGSIVLPFVITNGDYDVHDYKPSKDNKTLIWIDRVAEAVAKALANPAIPVPDPKAFLNACVDDPKVSPKWYGALGSLIDVSMDAPTRQKVWAQLKQDAEMAIPADAAAAIEGHAAKANMELK